MFFSYRPRTTHKPCLSADVCAVCVWQATSSKWKHYCVVIIFISFYLSLGFRWLSLSLFSLCWRSIPSLRLSLPLYLSLHLCVHFALYAYSFPYVYVYVFTIWLASTNATASKAATGHNNTNSYEMELLSTNSMICCVFFYDAGQFLKSRPHAWHRSTVHKLLLFAFSLSSLADGWLALSSGIIVYVSTSDLQLKFFVAVFKVPKCRFLPEPRAKEPWCFSIFVFLIKTAQKPIRASRRPSSVRSLDDRKYIIKNWPSLMIRVFAEINCFVWNWQKLEMRARLLTEATNSDFVFNTHTRRLTTHSIRLIAAVMVSNCNKIRLWARGKTLAMLRCTAGRLVDCPIEHIAIDKSDKIVNFMCIAAVRATHRNSHSTSHTHNSCVSIGRWQRLLCTMMHD